MTKRNDEASLAALIERGGMYSNVSGGNPREALAALVNLLPAFPGHEKNCLLQAVLEREALMSTGIGKGIALPHPRIPLLGEQDAPFVAAAFLLEPVDWNTPDGSKVHTLFLIVSSSAKQHLNTLSKINFLCQQENFYSLIAARASKEELIAAIRKAETAWEAGR
ncbi:MAG: PTS sugar transporter subunit IIA [Treponema sp.]|jgi:PTS system nitrogen regulatory IIA component|nr:PTS sugar transporter subunit IIA [Treponema sp.]